MKPIKFFLLTMSVLLMTITLVTPAALADGNGGVISDGRRAAEDPGNQARGGVRAAGDMPTDEGLTHPMTFLGGGRYRDANGNMVRMRGPDGRERWEWEDMDDYWKWKESQDTDWLLNHKGKFPGSYKDWFGLKQYGDPNKDLWGDMRDNYDYGVGSEIAQGTGEGNTNMNEMMGGY